MLHAFKADLNAFASMLSDNCTNRSLTLMLKPALALVSMNMTLNSRALASPSSIDTCLHATHSDACSKLVTETVDRKIRAIQQCLLNLSCSTVHQVNTIKVMHLARAARKQLLTTLSASAYMSAICQSVQHKIVCNSTQDRSSR